MPRALRRFLDTEAAGGVVLVVVAALAVAWANSPWRAGYASLWATEVRVSVGDVERTLDLRHVVNEALMALFFFVVGLEIKRELVAGELRTWRRAALPAIAAVGGMVVPALLFAAVNTGAEGSRGWGVPMATDIAFAVGVLALLGPRIPASLKVFLLTLAIVDDIGAIIVIALVYSGDVSAAPLAAAAAALGAVVALQRARVRWLPAFLALGVFTWAAVYESGVHATIAGVVLGLLAPARPLAPSGVAREWAADLADEPTPEELREMTRLANETVSVAERLEHLLHPLTSFVIIPLFALANAGVELERSALDAPGAGRVVAGVVAGLLVGKVLGISASAWLAVRMRVGALPDGVRGAHVVGASAVAGIGFTVSLFISDLAFDEPSLQAAAKIGILVASLLASVVGFTLLRVAARR
jgi:NhaA family Na+:H+ antiporter